MNTYQDKKYPTVSGAAAEDETVAGAASGAYRPSSTMGWNAQMENIMQQINDRKPFQFDLNGDALYQQYKDQYTNLGKLAMEDTMGQATGLTGGYGNTYAQNVGQQAYNAYLDKLNNIVPDIYAQQRAAYDAEGDRLYNQFNLANAMYGNAQAAEQQAYERDKADRAAADDKIISLIQMGITPAEEDIAASSYSADEIAAMKKWFANQQAGSGGSGGSGRRSSGGGGSYGGGGDYGPGVADYSNIMRTIRGYIQTGQYDKAKQLFMTYADQFNESQYNELKGIMGG